jgi:hypothetical protein
MPEKRQHGEQPRVQGDARAGLDLFTRLSPEDGGEGRDRVGVRGEDLHVRVYARTLPFMNFRLDVLKQALRLEWSAAGLLIRPRYSA